MIGMKINTGKYCKLDILRDGISLVDTFFFFLIILFMAKGWKLVISVSMKRRRQLLSFHQK